MSANEIDVKIVRLDPMRVATTFGFGPQPESVAWEKMNELLEKTSLMNDGQKHLFFGFNNPSPAPSSPNYGYEQWVTVGPETKEAEGVKVIDFSGGLYAVTRCNLSEITKVWEKLVHWREKSSYSTGSHQWLEECLTPPVTEAYRALSEDRMVFDLYMPIIE